MSLSDGSRIGIGENITVSDLGRAKRIVVEHYGQPPQFSYFTGCSQGGRQAHAEWLEWSSPQGRGYGLDLADRFGTDYIRSKYLAYQRLDELPNREAVTTFFPTLIFNLYDVPGFPVGHHALFALTVHWASSIDRADTMSIFSNRMVLRTGYFGPNRPCDGWWK